MTYIKGPNLTKEKKQHRFYPTFWDENLICSLIRVQSWSLCKFDMVTFHGQCTFHNTQKTICPCAAEFLTSVPTTPPVLIILVPCSLSLSLSACFAWHKIDTSSSCFLPFYYISIQLTCAGWWWMPIVKINRHPLGHFLWKSIFSFRHTQQTRFWALQYLSTTIYLFLV